MRLGTRITNTRKGTVSENPGNGPAFDPSILCDIFVISLFDSRNKERESPCIIVTNNGQVVLKGDGSGIS